MSDATHLTNFAGDRKAWPVYMTIGNLPAAVRNAPSTQSVLLVALLLVPIKLHDIPKARRDFQREHNQLVHQYVLRHLLAPLEHAEGGVFTARLPMGAPVAAMPPWLPGSPTIRSTASCRTCATAPAYGASARPTRWATTTPPHDRHHPRDHRLYAEWDAAGNTVSLDARRVNTGEVTLRSLDDCVVADLPKPDLLHTMHLGMLRHLLEWIHAFLADHKRLERFNNLWLSVPSYLTFTVPKMAYEEVSRWTGTALKQMSTFLLAVLRNALHGPTSAERGVFDRAILCTRALLEFFFYASYTSHDEATLNMMDNALRRFHQHRDVFLRYRAGKRVAAGARDRRAELAGERDADLAQMRRDGATAHALQVAHHDWRAFIDAEVVDCEEGAAHWNFPKLHLMLHFCDQVHRFGCLGRWSTEIGESSHCRQVKDGYNAGNRTGDVYLQIINHYLRLDAFTVRKLNFKAWHAAHSPTVSSAVPTVSPAAPTVSPAAPSVSPAAPPPRMRFVSPQFTSGPDRVSTLGEVFVRMWSDKLRAAIHHATRRFLHAHRVDLSDDDVPACPAAIYHGVQLDAEDMHGGSVRQRICCTGDRT
jgi:hypothetical protein